MWQHQNKIISPWVLVAGISAVSLVLTLMEENLGELFRYERKVVLQGEIWRLISGHLVHANLAHWLMNMAALAVMCLLFPTVLHGGRGAMLLFSLCLMTALGLMVLFPQLEWFVGLSGVLHGLFAVGALQVMSVESKRGWVLLGLLIFKLTYEQFGAGLPASQSLVGMRVISEAHLVGGVGGMIYWLVSRFFRGQKNNGP